MKLFRGLMPFLVGYDDILKQFGLEAPNAFGKHLCSFTSLFGYVAYVSCTVLMAGFLAFEAETFDDISEHFYEFATGLSETFYYVYVHLMCKQFFEMSNHFEEITKKRELFSLWLKGNNFFLSPKFVYGFKGSINDEKQMIYEKAWKLTEISSNCIYIGYVKVIFPLLTIPYLFSSYFHYFTTDLRGDAFKLPFVMW